MINLKKIFIVFLFLQNTIFSLNGLVTNVYDGDTITVVAEDTKKLKIRFYGIDAPEIKQNYGVESANFLRKYILNRNVELIIKSKDRYGRYVAEIFFNDVNINKEMLSNGYAWYYKQYAKGRKDLYFAMDTAKKDKKGLWQDENSIPPWEYRKTKKNIKH